MKNALENTISLMKRTSIEKCTEPRQEEHDEQYLLVVDTSSVTNEMERLEIIIKHYRYCLGKGISETLMSGFIINQANVIEKRVNDADGFFCEISFRPKNDILVIKPKGRYAVLDHQGSYDTIHLTFDRLFKFIENENLTINGNAYIFEVIGFRTVKNSDRYVIKIAIEVI